MSNIKNIYVVGSDIHYANFITNYKLVDKIEDANIVIFTGGEDVDPSLYNCKKHHTTYSNLARDLAEKKEFEKIKPNQLVVSVCRGSQFICVMNGGKLVQNVSGHALGHTHTIYDRYMNEYEITSTHHQMQYPFELSNKDYTCLFYSNRLSMFYEGDGIDNVLYEPEIVLYHKANMPKCLAIQGHPEYMRKESPIVIRLNEIIDKLLKNED